MRLLFLLLKLCTFNINLVLYIYIACRTPLMKNFDGQKYCVGCESWHFDSERSKKQRFGELVSLQGKQNMQLKNPKTTEISKLPTNLNCLFNLSNSVVTCLQLKLAYLTNQLSSITDLDDTQKLLLCIKTCIENINAAKAM